MAINIFSGHFRKPPLSRMIRRFAINNDGLSTSNFPNVPGLIIAAYSATSAPMDDPPNPVFSAPRAIL